MSVVWLALNPGFWSATHKQSKMGLNGLFGIVRFFASKKTFSWWYKKLSIDKACSGDTAGYWRRSLYFFALLWATYQPMLKKETKRNETVLTWSKTLESTCLSSIGTYLVLCGIIVGANASSMVSFLATRPCFLSHLNKQWNYLTPAEK